MTKAVLIEGHIVEKILTNEKEYSETIIKSQFAASNLFYA